MKHLPKHIRPRWRYLAVGIETWPDAEIDRGEFQRALWYAAQNLLGDPGSADADLSLVRFSFTAGAGEAIVRVRRGEVSTGRAALACLTEVDGQPVGVFVRGVSGTIRACEESYLGRGGGVTSERTAAFRSDTRPTHLRDGAADVSTETGFVGAATTEITVRSSESTTD
jgi:ribonuclease P/MRP protein subunit POP5